MKAINTLIPVIFLTALSCDNSETAPFTSSAAPIETQTALKVDSLEILRPSLWIYGGPPRERDRQRQIVDEWHKFRFVIKGGYCTSIPDPRTDQHNKTTDSVMSARNGKDWFERFEKSVDSLYAVDSTAIAIVQADSYIKSFEEKTEKYNEEYNFHPNLQYTAHFTPDKNIKIVTLEGYGVEYNDVGYLNYLRATVDIKRKKVISIDKTAYAW